MNPLAKSRLEAALELANRSLEDSVVWQLSPKEIEQRETILAALEFLLNPMVTEGMVSAAYNEAIENGDHADVGEFVPKINQSVIKIAITTLTAEDTQ